MKSIRYNPETGCFEKIGETKRENKKSTVGRFFIILIVIIILMVYGFINSESFRWQQTQNYPNETQTPSNELTPLSSNSSITSSEIDNIKRSLDSRLPGMEQAKTNGLTPTGINGAQKQINRLKEAKDPSWEYYQKRLDKLK